MRPLAIGLLLAPALVACSSAPAGDAGPGDAASGDAASTDAASTDAAASDAAASPDASRDGGEVCPTFWRHSIRAGASTDGSVSFELERCGELCVAGGCRVQPLAFSLTYGGATYRATASQIEYSATHHNWTDSLVATIADRRLRWRIEGGVATPGEYVSAEDLAGATLLAETMVRATER